MSGHSKWHSIKHKKAAADAKRGQLFTKLSKGIVVAAKKGGIDPDMNPALRLAIDKARGANMPTANIQRAIDKAAGGEGGAALKEVLYGAYGPEGTAFLIECLTDNSNRTIASLKTALRDLGGNWAEVGSVKWMFEKQGYLELDKEGEDDDLELFLIDLDVDQINKESGAWKVYCKSGVLSDIKGKLEEKNVKIQDFGLVYLAKEGNSVSKEGHEEVLSMKEALEEEEDVEGVYMNALCD